MRKNIVLLFAIVVTLLSGCSKDNNKGKIHLDAYILSSSFHRSFLELPISGIHITIDTIAKKIHIPLKGIVGENYIEGEVSKFFFPFYIDSINSVNYTILSIEHKTEMNSIIFHTKYKETIFKCAIFDSAFSIRMEDGTDFLYIGNAQAKEANIVLNNAKMAAIKALTGK